MVTELTDSRNITVSPTELNEHVGRRSWYTTNIIVWTFLLTYLFFSILDLIFAPYLWQTFLVVRLISVLLVYVVYQLVQQRGLDRRLPLHFMLIQLSLTYALLCNLVDMETAGHYFLTFAALFLLFNSVVYWEAVNSYLHAALAAILMLLCYYLFNQRYPLIALFEEGGQIFLFVALVSSYIPHVRQRLLWKETQIQLVSRRVNQQLQLLNEELLDENRLTSETNGKLQRINEHKNNFIYIAGHDLKNLVGTVNLSVNELQADQKSLNDDQREYVGFIAEATQRIQYLLNKLLNVKDIESPDIAFNYEIFGINDELDKVISGLRETASLKNIRLQFDPVAVPVALWIDPVFAGQIFRNLVSNAIRFAQPDNTLHLQATLDDGQFIFELTDPGQALGQDRLDALFHKLDELSHNNVNSPDQAGLGLSIALRLTEAMNGRLTYESRQETGNYYRIEFPSV